MQNHAQVGFTGTMDLDTELRFLSKGNYPYAENVRIGYSEGRAVGAAENMKGALLISNPDVAVGGRFQCIGATQDRMNNFLYYYICDKQGNQHGIYRYNYLTNNITKVYKNPSLAFSTLFKICSSDVILNTLFWTDNNQEIGQLYTPDAINGLYSGGILEYIRLGRKQPYIPIVCSTPTVNGIAFTDTMSFQFNYRYVYENGQKSRWSVPSLLYNTGYDPIQANPDRLGIQLTITNEELANAPLYSKIIAYVDIAFRNSDENPYRFYKRIKFPTVYNSVISDVFLNDKAYSAVDSSDIALNYDNLPLHSETVVVASNRHISANNTYGQNQPQFSVTNISNPPFTPVLNTMYLNTGGNYGLCLLFYDWLGRCNGAIPLDGSVPGTAVNVAIPSRNGTYIPYGVGFNLGGICPPWVAYYRVGITKMRNKGAFFDGFVSVVSTSATQLVFSANLVTPTPLTTTWVFTDGDRASIKCADASGTACSTTFYDMPLSFDATTGRYTITSKGAAFPLDIFTGTPLIEFFTPIQGAANDEFYYEIPVTYTPVTDVAGVRRYGVDFQGDQKSIIIGNGYGDTHYRKYTGNTTMTIGVENEAANDKYYQTWQHNIGRNWIAPTIVPQQYTDTKNIAFSDPFIPNANASTNALSLAVNGLNAYNPSNQNQLAVELGDIQKLIQATDYQVNGGVLLCITSTDAISYYLDKVQFIGTNGNRTFGVSDQFMNLGNLMQGNGGTLNPESAKAYLGRIYWWDVLKGVIWRYSTDGLTNLSQTYGTKAYCNSVGAASLKNRYDPSQVCPAFFDPYFMEYGVYLNDIKDPKSKILAFNEDKNGFSTFYTFQPEWTETVNQFVCSWKDGQLYVHRLGDVANEVYGTQLTSKVGFVFNDNQDENKSYKSVVVEAQDEWLPTLLRTQDNTTGDNPITLCMTGQAQIKEWDYWYAIQRAVPDVANGNVDIRGKYMYGELTLQQVDYLTRIYGIGEASIFSKPLKTPNQTPQERQS